MQKEHIMNSREQGVYDILTAAYALFRENGFQATSVRQIAEAAGVSLGMINHYFGSKEYLGAQVLSLLNSYLLAELPKHLVFEDDPILYDIVSVRLMFRFLFERGYKQFYLDSLKEDFFFKHLSSHPAVLINILKKKYSFDANEDEILLYSRYMPYMMEKTVILKKEEGFFPSIDYDDVPYLICHTAMSHFIPVQEIKARDAASKLITKVILGSLEDVPPHEMIVDFVSSYCATNTQNAHNPHSWLPHISSVVN